MVQNDVVNKLLITDCFRFILMCMNPFPLERKCENGDIISVMFACRDRHLHKRGRKFLKTEPT